MLRRRIAPACPSCATWCSSTPSDPRSATAEYEYLLGESLLVAPVIEQGAVTRKLYLPPGDWVNYWTGEHLTGGADVTVPAPLDQIPILVRSGSILPFKPDKETATLNWSDPNLLSGSLVWKVYPPVVRWKIHFHFARRHQRATAKDPDRTAHRRHLTHGPVLRSHSQPQAPHLPPCSWTAALCHQTAWRYDPTNRQLHATFTATNFTLVLA